MQASLPVTVVSSSVNFLLSGVMGCVLFNEKITMDWFLGATLIVIGVLLIISSQKVSSV